MSSIFLSYSSADVADVVRIRDLLVERGYTSVFRDKDPGEGIPAGAKWASELFLSLERVDIVVFLASERSLKSPWCHTELAVAVARGKYVVQISTTRQKRHPVLADREAIGPADVEALVGLLVSGLTRVGFPPGDPFSWDPNVSPYPGLARLDEDHAAVLFGRDHEIGAVLEALGRPTPSPVLVVGPSGTGKSSLIRAGVVPRLRLQTGTTVLPIVEPGADPIGRLAVALESADPRSAAASLVDDPAAIGRSIDRLVSDDAGRVVLVLDQAEDLVSRAPPSQALELVRRIRAIDRDRLAIVVVLRSASLDPWIRDPTLGSLTPTDPIWVRPLDRSDMREAIVGPARLAGIRFEPEDLVETILDDAGQGLALPLLAALMEELTSGHSRLTPTVITPERYGTVGPVAAVIERRAQAAVQDVRTELGRPESAVVDAYLRLAELDEHAQLTRDELPVDELSPEAQGIFLVLERHRLVTRDRDGREVLMAVHEEVFRAWPALKAALEARTADLQTRTWLRKDAAAWADTGRGQVPLAGGRLDVAKDWARRNGAEVAPVVRDYLDRANRQQRSGRLLRVAAAAVPILFIGLGAVGLVAFQAVKARETADTLRLVGDARANLDARRDLALLLAVQAQGRSDDPQAQAIPLVALTQGPGPSAYQRLGAPLQQAALSGDGSRAVLGADDQVLLRDVAAGSTAGAIAARPTALGISGDGNTVAIAFQGQDAIEVHAWPSTAPSRTCPVDGVPSIIRLTDKGDLILAVLAAPTGDAQQVVTIDTTDCTVQPFTDITGGITDVAIGADGVAFALGKQPVQLWAFGQDLATFTYPADDADIRAVALDDRHHIAGLTAQGQLMVWDATSDLTPVQKAPAFDGSAGIGLRPADGAWVAADASGAIRMVRTDPDIDLGPIVRGLPDASWAGEVAPLDIAVRAGGVVTADPSGRVVTWDLVGRPPLGEDLDVGVPVESVLALPDGSIVGAGPSRVVLRQGTSGRVVDRWQQDAATGDVTALGGAGATWAFGTSRGEVFLATGPDGAATSIGSIRAGPIQAVQPLASGGVAVAQAGPDSPGDVEPRSLAIVADGRTTRLGFDHAVRTLATTGPWLFVGLADGSIHVIDTRDTPHAVGSVREHAGDIASMAVAPDGRILVSGSDDRHIFAWAIDAQGGLERVRDLTGHTDRITSLAFSPDGEWLASGSEDRHVILWPTDSDKPFSDPIFVNTRPSVAFDQQGDRQLYVAADGMAHWDLRESALAKAACDIAARPLTAAESLRYLGVEKETDPCATGS